MSIFKDSYQTTVGSISVTKQIEHAIKEAIIKDNINNVNLDVNNKQEYKPIFITGAYSSENDIPLFTHPITINFKNVNYVCTDVRLYVTKNVPIDEINSSVKNRTEFNFAKSRGILNLVWLNNGVNSIKNSLGFAGIVFSAWLSETISKTYALDFKDQTVLAIVTSLYYQSLFIDGSELDDDTKQRLAVHTIKATKAPAQMVFEVFDKIKSFSSIEDYCSTVKEVLENVRMKDFNLAMLLTIVRNSWYGTNSKEIISVALEHPPTWCAIVYTALNERTFKNSMIYRIAERFGKRGASDEFVDSYVTLVKDYTVAVESFEPIREFV